MSFFTGKYNALHIKLPSTLQDTLPPPVRPHWERLEAAHQLPAVNSVRINPKKYTAQFDQAQRVPWCDMGRYLHQRPAFTFDPLFHAGTYYVQEASSMFLEYALQQYADFAQHLNILDLCAAPGGKSTHIASLMSDESLLISNEVIGSRVNVLTENMSKWGYGNTWVSNNDPAHFKKLPYFFDMVLVDAPCSGSGLFRKIPVYCNSWNPELVSLCAQRQKRILHDVYNSLAQNGLLVYMTCSLCREENEDILDFLLEEYELESCRILMHADMGIVETQSDRRSAWGYRLMPHLLKGEGFFLAILRKKDGEAKAVLKQGAMKNISRSDLSRFIKTEGETAFLQNEHLILIRESHEAALQYLNNKLKIVKKGVLIGKQLPKEIIPSHELALFTGCAYAGHIAELDLKNAIAFLKKEHIDFPSGPGGWYLVKYAGNAIGWLKNLGNRINNYYPSNYRILSQQAFEE